MTVCSGLPCDVRTTFSRVARAAFHTMESVPQGRAHAISATQASRGLAGPFMGYLAVLG